MPDKYDISYAQQVIELLPPDKRFKNITAYLTDCMKSTVQFLRDAFLGDYRLGSTAPAYVAGTYGIGQKIIYNKGEYVSLIPNNTDAPTVISSWYLVFPNFIGVTERQQYNGQKVVLEYALNRWFGTTFRQPGAGLSDIYLSNNTKSIAVFISGGPNNSSSTYGDHSTEFSINSYSFANFVNLTINVPSAVYNALDANPLNRDNIILSFANKYILAGITYTIAVY